MAISIPGLGKREIELELGGRFILSQFLRCVEQCNRIRLTCEKWLVDFFATERHDQKKLTCLLVAHAGLGSVGASVAVHSVRKVIGKTKLWKLQSSMNVRFTKRSPLKVCRTVGKRR